MFVSLFKVRDDAMPIVLFITDGKSTKPSKTSAEAEEMQNFMEDYDGQVKF